MGVGSILFSWRTRTPVTIAWSTPGAALLAGAAAPGAATPPPSARSSWPVCSTSSPVVRPLGRWVPRIPTSLASAMLAGVLLMLCAQPFPALAADPPAIAPVVLTWLVLLAGPAVGGPRGLLAALVVVVATGSLDGVGGRPGAPPDVDHPDPRPGRHRRARPAAVPGHDDQPEHPGRRRARLLRLRAPLRPALV